LQSEHLARYKPTLFAVHINDESNAGRGQNMKPASRVVLSATAIFGAVIGVAVLTGHRLQDYSRPASQDAPAQESLHARIVRELPTLRQTVADLLRDPDSARFRDVWAVRPKTVPNSIIFCGEVTGRNAFDGYADYMTFFGTDTEAWLVTNQVYQKTYDQFCGDGERLEQVDP
jgi:hypothetical protein